MEVKVINKYIIEYSLIISFVQAKKIHAREHHLDDEGYLDKNGKNKVKKKNYFFYLIKQII